MDNKTWKDDLKVDKGDDPFDSIGQESSIPEKEETVLDEEGVRKYKGKEER